MKAHLALCTLLVGCVADPPELGEPESISKIKAGTDCDEWECGTNSGTIPLAGDIWDVPEVIGARNSTGYTLTFFGKRTWNTFEAYVPSVEYGVVRASRNGQQATSVVGMMWRLEKVVNNETRRYEVVITGVDTHPFLARNNNAPAATHGPRATTYRLKWREYLPSWPTTPATHGPPLFDLCGENVGDDGMADFSAVIFEDDMIDPEQIRVTGDNNPNDVIGCAGHALAKQHLAGYTKASATVLQWPVPSVQRRTAHLKAVTGDYFGIGVSFTYAGVSLLRRDNFVMPSSMGGGYRLDTTTKVLPFFYMKRLEARWNHNGAICLNTPRVDFRANPEDDVYFPGGVEPLLATFATVDRPRPPPCTGSYTDNVSDGYITTVNYGMMPISQQQL